MKNIKLRTLLEQTLKESTHKKRLKEAGKIYEMGVDIEDIEFELTFEFIPGERSTYDDPGSGADVDIKSLKYKGVDFWNFIYEIHKDPKKFQRELEDEAIEFAMSYDDDGDGYDDWRDRR